MQFAFTQEQLQFRDIVRRYLASTAPPAQVRKLMESESGFDHVEWPRLARELGACAVHVPEAYGGAGLGVMELGIVMEEMGRALYCGPYFATTALAATAILVGGSERQRQALLPEIAAGNLRATLAITEADTTRDGDAEHTVSERDDRLTGTRRYVVDGATADRIVVPARAAEAGGSTALYLVDATAAGLTRTPLATIDATRRLSDLQFDDTPAERLGGSPDAADVIDHVFHVAAVSLANEMVGGAARMLESALDYTKARMQFGRSIGSFQAIKHRMADLLLEVELARSAAYAAASAFDAGDANLVAFASLAKSACADAFVHAAAECIQLHGGIGFTWDHDTHLWYRRARSSQVLLGDPAWHRERMIANWSE